LPGIASWIIEPLISTKDEFRRNDGSTFTTGNTEMKTYLKLAITTATLAIAVPANAATVTSLSGATSIVMPDLGLLQTVGPVVFGPITYTSTSVNSVIGYSGGYGFNGNGFWEGTPMAGLNAEVGTMTFDFATPVAGVLAEMNWAAPSSSNGRSIFASIFDTSGALLETKVFSTNGDTNTVTPGYWGFHRSAANIGRLTLSNGYIGARDFSTTTDLLAAVPEPASWALMIAGFGLVGSAMRRRKPSVSVSYA
jgi:hypothetical protein